MILVIPRVKPSPWDAPSRPARFGYACDDYSHHDRNGAIHDIQDHRHLILLMILASLGSGLVFLIRDGGRRSPARSGADRADRCLSIGLFVLLMLAYATGLISPHGL